MPVNLRKKATSAGMGAGLSTAAPPAPEAGESTGVSGLLHTLQGHVEDLRTLTTCSVCIKSLYEPFSLSCGHTFCYSCLSQWFHNKRRKTCPDCRGDVVQQPAPNYLVRELTQIFIERPELLGAGETTDQHKQWQRDEATNLETDKANTDPIHGGLFRGSFRRPTYHIGVQRRRYPGPLRDVEDGVDRCPLCMWELEDGRCSRPGCAYREDGLEDETSDSGTMGEMDSMDGLSEEDIDHDMDVTDMDGTDDEELGGMDEGARNREFNAARRRYFHDLTRDEIEAMDLFRHGNPFTHLTAAHDLLESEAASSIGEGSYDSFSADQEVTDDDDDDSLDGFIEPDEDGSHHASVPSDAPPLSDPEDDTEVESQYSTSTELAVSSSRPWAGRDRRRHRRIVSDDEDVDDDGDTEIPDSPGTSITQTTATSEGASQGPSSGAEISSSDDDEPPRPPAQRASRPFRVMTGLHSDFGDEIQELIRVSNRARAITNRTGSNRHPPHSSQSSRASTPHDRHRVGRHTSSNNTLSARRHLPPRVPGSPPAFDSVRSIRRTQNEGVYPRNMGINPPFITNSDVSAVSIAPQWMTHEDLNEPPQYFENIPNIESIPTLSQGSRRNSSDLHAILHNTPDRTRNVAQQHRIASAPIQRDQQNTVDARLHRLMPQSRFDLTRNLPVPANLASIRGGGSGSRSSPVTLSSPQIRKRD